MLMSCSDRQWRISQAGVGLNDCARGVARKSVFDTALRAEPRSGGAVAFMSPDELRRVASAAADRGAWHGGSREREGGNRGVCKDRRLTMSMMEVTARPGEIRWWRIDSGNV